MKPGNCCSRGVQKVARTLQDLLTIPTPQIIIAQHDNRRAGQIRPKNTLTTGVEAVAVSQRKNRQGWIDGSINAHDRERCS